MICEGCAKGSGKEYGKGDGLDYGTGTWFQGMLIMDGLVLVYGFNVSIGLRRKMYYVLCNVIVMDG